MFALSVTEKGGAARRLDFEKAEVNVGRIQGNDVVLPKGNVSKRHARIVAKDGKFVIVDLKSTNGTFVNGRRISGPLVISPSDKVYIGDFILQLEQGSIAASERSAGADLQHRPPPPPPGRRRSRPSQEGDGRISRPGAAEEEEVLAGVPQVRATSPVVADAPDRSRRWPTGSLPPAGPRDTLGSDPPPSLGSTGAPKPPSRLTTGRGLRIAGRSGGAAATAAQPMREVGSAQELRQQIHQRLSEFHEGGLAYDRAGDDELWEKAESAVRDIADAIEGEEGWPPQLDKELVIRDVVAEAVGLGPLEDLMSEPDVTQILVNRADQIFVERDGRLELVERRFTNDRILMEVIARLVAPRGVEPSDGLPIFDVRLADGSRVNAVLPPLALHGPCVTVERLPAAAVLSPGDLVEGGSLSKNMLEFLASCVSARQNILIGGGASAGKTTLLNALASFVADEDRIVTIEDPAELQLKQTHWVQLEGRPAAIGGQGGISSRDLLRNAMRMRPDRVILGECRGSEALELLQLMNTGHDGSMSATQSNSPKETVARLETMAMMGAPDLPARLVREQIASAVDIVIHVQRYPDGARRIAQVAEVLGMDGDELALQEIFRFHESGFDTNGGVRGDFLPSGVIPRFYEGLRRSGVAVNTEIFRA